MIKIIFNRKNKTLHSCFVTKSVLKILEENYKTYCSLNNEVRACKALLFMINPAFIKYFYVLWLQLPEGDIDMKKKVEEVLAFEKFGEKRGAKMDQDDFLLYVSKLILMKL